MSNARAMSRGPIALGNCSPTLDVARGFSGVWFNECSTLFIVLTIYARRWALSSTFVRIGEDLS
jgi:hypothetical protein